MSCTLYKPSRAPPRRREKVRVCTSTSALEVVVCMIALVRQCAGIRMASFFMPEINRPTRTCALSFAKPLDVLQQVHSLVDGGSRGRDSQGWNMYLASYCSQTTKIATWCVEVNLLVKLVPSISSLVMYLAILKRSHCLATTVGRLSYSRMTN